MKCKKTLFILVLIVCVLIVGCTKSEETKTQSAGNQQNDIGATQSEENTAEETETEPQTEADKYEPYTWEWLAERESRFLDLDDDEVNQLVNFCEWLKEQEEYQEYFHNEDEYWDSEGNFVYPDDVDTIYDSEWVWGGVWQANATIAAATMPQKVMDELSTDKLLEIANSEKAVASAAVEGRWDEEYTINVVYRSAAYREFLKRDDYPQAVYEYYVSIEPEEYFGTEFDVMGMMPKKAAIVSVTEVTIVTDKVFEALDEQQRLDIIAKKEEIREYLYEINPDYNFVEWDWYSTEDLNVHYFPTTFDTVIAAGVSPEWTAYVQALEI